MPTTAFAQSLPVELAAGYASIRVKEETFPAGWYADIAVAIGRRLWIVGEVSGNYKSRVFREHPQLRVTRDAALHSWMFGARVFTSRRNRLRPFAQAMIGGVRASSTTRVEALIPGIPGEVLRPIDRVDFGGGLQFGGGLNLQVTDPVAARAMADYRRMMFGEGWDSGLNAVRVVGGVVFVFGPR